MFLKMIMKVFWWLLVKGWMPDVILRWKIRGGLSGLMAKMDKEEKNYEERVKFENDFVKEIKESPQKYESNLCQFVIYSEPLKISISEKYTHFQPQTRVLSLLTHNLPHAPLPAKSPWHTAKNGIN